LADETTSEDITINDIMQKYVPNKLRGLRLLVLMACSTGGVPKTEKQSLKIVSEPQEGTLAHAFRQAKVQCVVYTLDTIYWISVTSFMNDFWPIATKIKYYPESSKKLSPSPPGITMTISVQQAVVRTIQKIADALVNQTGWSALIIARDITLIRVAGDTKLAP